MKATWMTLGVLWLVLCGAVVAATPTDFSGTWIFSPGRSQNIGMMASLQYTSIATQTDKLLVTHDLTVFDGKEQSRDTRYDLSGAEVPNESSRGEPSRTVTHWEGSQLVTQWTSAGAIAGTTVVRMETRSLASDRKTMSVQFTRTGNPPLVLVFERK